MDRAPSHRVQKLSVYDQDPPALVLVPAPPSQLETSISSVRRSVQSTWQQVSSSTQAATNRWIGLEQSAEGQIKSLRAPEEQLSPAVLYIGVAAMAGSIVTRNRNILLRFLAPPALLFAASSYLLPHTTLNVRSYLWDIERRRAPSVADAHQALYDSTQSTRQRLRESAAAFVQRFSSTVQQGTQKVEQASGMTLRERPPPSDKTPR